MGNEDPLKWVIIGFSYLLKYKLTPEKWCVEDILSNAITRLNENLASYEHYQ